MKKSILLPILFCICMIILSTLGCVKANPEVNKLFIMDNSQNRVLEIPVKYGIPEEIRWSPDSKYFAFVEKKEDWRGNTKLEEIKLFDAATLNEKKIPDDVNDKEYTYRSLYWIDNQNVLIAESDDKGKRYRTYDIIKESITVISEQEADSYLGEISVKEDADYNRYILKEEDRRLLSEKVVQDYSRAIRSNDKSRFLYSNRMYKTYLYDMKSTINKYILDGFQIDWSLKETKITYKLHKTLKLEELKVDEDYSGKEFITYLFDIEKNKALKIADFYADCYFSPNDEFIIFYESDYDGSAEL